MQTPRLTRLLSFARRLQHAAGFEELLSTARQEVVEATGYQHVWLMVADDEDVSRLRLIQTSSEHEKLIWEVAPVLDVKEDPFIQAIVASDLPVVVEDARTDPRTDKRIVEQLQNRTLINIPLRLLDKPFGIFGTGTFGDEGCRAPNEEQLEYLVGMAVQLAVAAGRIRFQEAAVQSQRQHRELERRVLHMQKLESLGLLAGGIAHDFNNLLTVILAGASLAEALTKDERILEELRSTLEAAGRARELTRKLLAMSRTQDLDLRTLDLNERLTELVALVRRVLPASIDVELIKGMHLPLVHGDASQLDQVFMNLCINARDAMPDGGRLTVETEQVLFDSSYTAAHPWARAGRYVLVTVSDSGIGMKAEIMERVFEPFFTTKSGEAGTGLGLAVSYGIVRQHEGLIQCYSEVGVGTSFKVYLPVHERLATNVGRKLESARPLGSEHILIAEDNTAVRQVTIRVLEQAGYRVTAAADGEAALRAAQLDAPDLVILDVVMPGAPCAVTVERIRSARPESRILLCSGYTAQANVSTLVESTGFALLRKPYHPDELLRSVRRALDAPRAER